MYTTQGSNPDPHLQAPEISFTIVSLFMCMDVLTTYMSVDHAHASCPWKPEEDINTLELQLQMRVSCYVVLRIKPESSGKSASACKPGVISSASSLLYGSQGHRVGEGKALRPTSSIQGMAGQPGLHSESLSVYHKRRVCVMYVQGCWM